jgi:hypothetical protein
MEAARSILHSSNAPLWLWSEAVRYASYILNRVPSSEKLKTPFEIFYRIKPDVSNIRVFGSLTFILCPDQDRKKVDDKSLIGIMVGFDEEQKGYRIYVPSKRKVIVTAQPPKDENTMFNYKIENPVASSFTVSPLDPFMSQDQVTLPYHCVLYIFTNTLKFNICPLHQIGDHNGRHTGTKSKFG